MGSDLALRVYGVSKEANKPMPTFSDDDVIDFMVTEAVVAHAAEMRREAEQKAKRDEWKKRPVGSGLGQD